MRKITVIDARKSLRPVVLTGEVSAGYTVEAVQRLFATGFGQVVIEEEEAPANTDGQGPAQTEMEAE